MSLKLFLGFLPWILYLILAGNTLVMFESAIIVGLVTSIICQLYELKKGFILSWGTLLFFMFMTVSVVILKNSWVIENAGWISNSALPLIVFISLIIGMPFTLQYAKEVISPDKWQQPLFIRINYLLTILWQIIFLLSLVVYLIFNYYKLTDTWSYVIISYIPIFVGLWINIWFPNWYKNLIHRKRNP